MGRDQEVGWPLAEEQAGLGISPILDSMCLCPVSPGSSHSILFLTPGQYFSKCVSWFKTKKIGQRMSVECLPNVHEALGLIPQHCISQTRWKVCLGLGPGPTSCGHSVALVSHGCSPVEGNASLLWLCWRQVVASPQCWFCYGGWSKDPVLGGWLQLRAGSWDFHSCNLMVTPGDVLGRNDPLVCGNEDCVVLEGAQATVRSVREFPVKLYL